MFLEVPSIKCKNLLLHGRAICWSEADLSLVFLLSRGIATLCCAQDLTERPYYVHSPESSASQVCALQLTVMPLTIYEIFLTQGKQKKTPKPVYTNGKRCLAHILQKQKYLQSLQVLRNGPRAPCILHSCTSLQRPSHKLSPIFWPMHSLLGDNNQGREITWMRRSMMAIVTHTRNATLGYVNALPSSRIQLHVTDRSLSAHRMMEMRSASHISQAGIEILLSIQHQALSHVCVQCSQI